ncbi:formimidoylglutamate deiminase [Novosphingobium sp. 1949]|uniref:Formimidoylglutamate deiminase n=1 Tax=Novosphingobium organovorum TaxID=2930092 RepID=A0ABT0BD63_9SPHN|nr:formimidoylglutamate deiminase [Novosphingobium organovorum]MCJ2183007.1 formimidoylglutamate deiminase [Novosphingobium organovorum]
MPDVPARAETGLFFDSALLPGGWARDVRVGIVDGKIASVAVEARAQDRDERHAIALPGMPNLHSHAFQRGMAGLAEWRGDTADSFWTWREIMYRFVRTMTPEDVRAIAAMAMVEMLETGFTRLGEFHYLHHAPDGTPYANRAQMAGALAEAARASGIGLTLLPVFYAHSGFGGQAPGEGQRRFLHDIEGFARTLEESRAALADLPDAVLGLAPHSLRAVTPEELHALEGLAGSGPIHIHSAEQRREVDDCLAWSGARPVEWLLANANVDARWCLVHATHMTGAETRALAASGAVAGLCPITEANLGDGLFPAPAFLDAGGRFGIGSDSNVRIDASEELRLLEYGQRLGAQARNVWARGAGESSGGALWRGALAGGAQALGVARGGVAAGIALGNSADILTLDADHPALAARAGDALIDGFVFAGGSGVLDCVWRHGEKVVVKGIHRDRPAIRERFISTLQRLLA